MFERIGRWRVGGAAAILAAALVSPAAAQEGATTADVGSSAEADDLSGFVRMFSIRAFADVDYVAKNLPGEHSGFENGALDLYMTARLSEHWSGLAELVFENSGNEIGTDLERFQLTWQPSDLLRATVGRIHNPLIRWNVTQHHGLFLQTCIDKPAISRWEDSPGLWPAHFVGVLASGRIGGPLGITYDAGVGNGRGHILDDVQVGRDENGSKAELAAIGVAPEAVPGLDVAVTGYFDEIPADAGTLRERDVTVSATYLAGGVEFRGEWSRMNHLPDAGGGSYRTTGWYALLSDRLPGRWSEIRPYLLVERLDPAKDEAFLEGAPEEKAWAAGVRWDVEQWLAIKADYRSQEVGDLPREGLVRIQLAASF